MDADLTLPFIGGVCVGTVVGPLVVFVMYGAVVPSPALVQVPIGVLMFASSIIALVSGHSQREKQRNF
jgi:hypothetical protein